MKQPTTKATINSYVVFHYENSWLELESDLKTSKTA